MDEKELVAGGRRVRQGNAPVVRTNKHYLASIDREQSRAASRQTENKLFTLAKSHRAPSGKLPPPPTPTVTHKLKVAGRDMQTQSHQEQSWD